MFHHLFIPVMWFFGLVGLDASYVMWKTPGESVHQLIGLCADLRASSGGSPFSTCLDDVWEEAADEVVGATLHHLCWER